MKKANHCKWVALLLVAVLFSGCAGASAPNADATTAESSAVTEETTMPEPSTAETSSPMTEPLTEATLPALQIEPGDYIMTFTDENTEDYLDYYLFIPENATENMSLLIFLHGDGEVGQIDKLKDFGPVGQAKEIYGSEYPFIIISPCTRHKTWIDGTIPATLKGLIDHVAETYNVDRDRIVISGHSRGAIGTWNMVSLYGDFFSAAVPISCGTGKALDMDNMVKVPVWGFAGTGEAAEQEYMGRMKNLIQRITEAGGPAQLTVLEGATHGETSSLPFTKETFEWMLSQ